MIVLRKIRNGRVKINHKWLYPKKEGFPEALPYDGRLDNKVFGFGIYLGETFVSLWGTEKFYRCDNPDDDNADIGWPGDNCIDGTFHWVWWDEKK